MAIGIDLEKELREQAGHHGNDLLPEPRKADGLEKGSGFRNVIRRFAYRWILAVDLAVLPQALHYMRIAEVRQPVQWHHTAHGIGRRRSLFAVRSILLRLREYSAMPLVFPSILDLGRLSE